MPLPKIMKGEQKMLLRYILLGMLFETLLILLIVFLVKVSKSYKYYKEFEKKRKSQEAFRKKMEELEIK